MGLVAKHSRHGACMDLPAQECCVNGLVRLPGDTSLIADLIFTDTTLVTHGEAPIPRAC